ncbi:MAG: hypothetical protein ACPGGJ_01435, partial [Coraliomargarita sp.]
MKHIASILAGVALVAAAALGYLFYSTNNKLAETTSQLNASRSAEAATKAALESANSNIQTLEDNLAGERKSLADTRKLLNSTRSDLARQRQDNTRLNQNLSEAASKAGKLQEQNQSLGRQLATMRNELTIKEDNKDRIAELEEQLLALQKASSDMQQKMKLAEAKAVAAGGPPESSEEKAPAISYRFNNRPAVQPATLGPEVTIASTRYRDGMLVIEANGEAG